jgi:acyl-CoA synthetase (AMP-forming)/AMP-acid ligase II
MNFVDPILFQCRLNAPALAIGAPGEALDLVSYGRLERFIHNASRVAHRVGLERGQTVAIRIADNVLHAAIILGLARLGVVTVSAYGRMPEELRIDAVIADEASGQNGRSVIRADPTWIEGDGLPIEDSRLYQGGGGDLCRIILTSGTTGEPKAIGLTHDQIAARTSRLQFACGNRFQFCSRLFCDLGLPSSPAFRYMISMLSRGGTILFSGDPHATMQAFDLYKVQGFAAAPSGLAEYLKVFEAYDSFQCGFDHIITTGGMMPKSLADRVRSRMCSNLFASYGATETGPVAVASAQALASIPGAVGFVLPDCAVEIVDDKGHPLPSGEKGIVRIRGPHNAQEYLGDPVESARTFRDGYFHPGDIGYLSSDRLLVISGREKSVLNIGGNKISPETIEAVIASFRGIDQAAVFSEQDEIGVDQICAVIVSNAGFDEQLLRTHCEQRLAADFVPARFVRSGELPRNEQGKLIRGQLAEAAGPRMT